ncbi:MAG: FtsW/RodA/SpoVE family cell cycle protein, partial [Longimicrobiales bacterium]
MRALLRRWTVDPGLTVGVLLLSVFGIAMIYSAGVLNVPSPVTEGAWIRQLVWLGLGLMAFTVVSRVPLRWIEWAAFSAYVFTVVLLGATLVVGTGRGSAQGVRSWIEIGG